MRGGRWSAAAPPLHFLLHIELRCPAAMQRLCLCIVMSIACLLQHASAPPACGSVSSLFARHLLRQGLISEIEYVCVW